MNPQITPPEGYRIVPPDELREKGAQEDMWYWCKEPQEWAPSIWKPDNCQHELWPVAIERYSYAAPITTSPSGTGSGTGEERSIEELIATDPAELAGEILGLRAIVAKSERALAEAVGERDELKRKLGEGPARVQELQRKLDEARTALTESNRQRDEAEKIIDALVNRETLIKVLYQFGHGDVHRMAENFKQTQQQPNT